MKHQFVRCITGLAALVIATVSGVAVAGKITGVKVEPASAQVGTPVQVIVAGEDEGVCGLRVEYGNGDFDLTKMTQGKDNFPRSFSKSYNKAGNYTIIVKGGRDGTALGCPGDAKVQVAITEAPKPAAAAAPAAGAATAPVCPEGYALNAKSVNKTTGAFTCTAKKGATKPEKALACTAGTEYFATPKGSSLGCRKAAPAKK